MVRLTARKAHSGRSRMIGDRTRIVLGGCGARETSSEPPSARGAAELDVQVDQKYVSGIGAVDAAAAPAWSSSHTFRLWHGRGGGCCPNRSVPPLGEPWPPDLWDA
jgi:hypothetical protein